MARNRRNQSGAVRFVPALKTILLCMLIGGSAVGYVLQKNKLYELGRHITRRETQLDRLARENTLWESKLAELQSPLRLAERVKDQKLGLQPPSPTQMIWLVEPMPKPEPQTPSLLAARQQ